ncbi:MAG: glycosyltransferase [Phycisphaeraceae bacterium]|nr:glycosyltransferase [Phycisphaeraceae bacterium]
MTDCKDRGGAAISARRQAQALQAAGHEILWAADHVDQFGPGVYRYSDYAFGRRMLRQSAGKAWPKTAKKLHANFKIARLLEIVAQTSPDVINVHNIHGAELPGDLPARLSLRRPVVWTLHDMWAFTGTCAYSYACRAFETGCHAQCPHHNQYPALPAKQVGPAYERRISALHKAGQLAFVTPSQWLANEAWRGMLRGARVEVIPYSLDLEVFRPIARQAARAALGIPQDKLVILSAAANQHDPRKGTAILQQALQNWDGLEILWLTVGAGGRKETLGKVQMAPLGSLSDERLVALAYNAAEVFVLPTLADNLPNTLLEAAACGTPSLGSNVGGVGEVIIPGHTGWLAPAGEVEALRQTLRQALLRQPGETEQWRVNCRQYALSRYAPALQAERYAQLYAQLTGKTAGSAALEINEGGIASTPKAAA